MFESSIAPFLTTLQASCKDEGIRVGSYPKFNSGVVVSIIGQDEKRCMELVAEVVKELNGTIVGKGTVGEEVEE